jgi:hypothetical protein
LFCPSFCSVKHLVSGVIYKCQYSLAIFLGMWTAEFMDWRI